MLFRSSLSIVFTTIGVNWFYQGIEDFKYITIRALVIRVLSAASLFIFVKNESDLLIYGFIIVGSTVGNNLANFVHLRKYIDWGLIEFGELRIIRHIKPALQVFILNLIISLYVQLNSIMLGFMSGDESVGFFTAGTKMTHIGLTVITSLGTVLLPRCSHLLQAGDKDGFTSVINKSLDVTLAFSLPMAVGLMILASPVIRVFCGGAYQESIPVLYFNAPVIVLISLTNVMGIQVLYPMDKVWLVIMSVMGGAIVNVALNLILITHYGAVGAAVATLMAESMVLFLQLILGRKYYPFNIGRIVNWRYIWGSGIMAIVVYLLASEVSSDAVKLIVGTTIGIVVYFISLIIMKDQLSLEIVSMVFKKIYHGNKI